MDTLSSPEGTPIEVWLTQTNMEITCMVVREDESTYLGKGVDSISMRGAQREITGDLIGEGYSPVGRWEGEEGDDRVGVETSRKFKRAA